MTPPSPASAGQLTERTRDAAEPSADPQECPDPGRHSWGVESFRAHLHPEPHAPRHSVANVRPDPDPVEPSAAAVPFSSPAGVLPARIELPSLDGYMPAPAAEDQPHGSDPSLARDAPLNLEASTGMELPDAAELAAPCVASFELRTYVPEPYDGHTAASYAAALNAGTIESDAADQQHDDDHVELRTTVAEPSPVPAPIPAAAIADPQRAKQARPARRRRKPHRSDPESDSGSGQRVPVVEPVQPAPAPALVLPTYIPDPYDGTSMAAYSTSTLTPIATWNAAAALRARRARLRRRKWIAAAATLLLAGAGAGAGYRVLHHGNSSSPWTLPVGSGVTGPAGTLAPGPGLAFHSVAGHYAVRLEKRPVEQITKSSVSGQSLTAAIASIAAARTIVQEATIAPGVPAEGAESFLSGVLHGIAGPGVITLATETATAFRGRPARMGTYSTKSGPLTVLSVLYGTQRSYLLMAPSGAAFTALESSFVPLQ